MGTRDRYESGKFMGENNQYESNGNGSGLTFAIGIFVLSAILVIGMFIMENWQYVFWMLSPFVILAFLIKKRIFYWVERIGFFIGILLCCWPQSFAVLIRSHNTLPNSGPNLLIGLLNTISYISLIVLFLVMGVPRLKKLYKKYFDPLRKEIRTKQSGVEYDPDSSPMAFKHYQRVYASEDCPIMSKFDWSNIDTRNHLLNLDYQNTFERLYIKVNNDNIGLGNSFLLGGETDFNFNEKKFYYLMQILRKEKVHHKDFIKLQFCNQNHHSVVNFSLMPATGAMGNFKGHEKFDRLDYFIYSLNEFYVNGNQQVLSEAKGRNKEYLLHYLNSFRDIYDYCRQIYFIDDIKFVDKLIINGRKPLESREDVVRYMNLAIDYWNRKEQYFKKVLNSKK